MKKVELLGPGNGGDVGTIVAACEMFPFLKEIRANQDVSVLRILPPEDFPAHTFATNGMGTTYLIIEGKIARSVGWDAMRGRRSELGLPEDYLDSPQAELSGKENACVLVQHHSEREQKWISIEAFICPPGATFEDYDGVNVWLAKVRVHTALKQAGYL